MSDGFFKRGKIWWFRTDPLTGKQASSGKRDIKSAELEYRERSRRATNPDYRPETTEDNSLNGWAVKFVEHKEATKSAATAKFYAAKLGHLVRIFGADTPISNALRPTQFDAYALARKAEGARPTTIRKEIGAARTLARFAARAGGYHGRPELFMPGDLSDDYEPGERFLTPSELVSLLAELPEHRAAHVALAVAIGCRFSETFRVMPADVDTGAWLVTIRGTKTKRSRATVPVAEPFRELLRAALPYLPLRPWLNSNMKRDLAKACTKAGIAPVTSNDLRRTHGTWLAEAGVSDEHIGKVLRHADGRMARRVYGKLGPERLGAILSATIVQQLSPRSDATSAETPVIADESTEGDMRIENPRVGGSTPSRDTAKNQPSQEVGEFAKHQDVAPGTAKARSVRNENATADGGAFVKRRSPVRNWESAPAVRQLPGEQSGNSAESAGPDLVSQAGPNSVVHRLPGDSLRVEPTTRAGNADPSDPGFGWLGPQPPPSEAGDIGQSLYWLGVAR